MAEPGQALPAGFGQAVKEAEASRTVASGHHELARHGASPQRLPIETPRLAALRARVAAKEAAAKGRLLARPAAPKRRRLRKKQADPELQTV